MGRDFLWPKPEGWPQCRSRIWGHGYVPAYFDEYDQPLWLKRYWCPDCGCVIRLIEAGWLNLAEGNIKMLQVTKIDSEDDDRLPLDLTLVTPLVEMAWATREKTRWEGENLWVVSREGLMAMKSLMGSGQDQDDLKKLKALDDEN